MFIFPKIEDTNTTILHQFLIVLTMTFLRADCDFLPNFGKQQQQQQQQQLVKFG